MAGETAGRDSDMRDVVREGYARIATGEGTASCGCCGSDDGDEAVAMGYSAEDLATLPEGASMGLGCGNPTALASLVPGEVVVDLGSGGGIDVFLAGQRVGASGRAIGVDMTAEMLKRARANANAYRDRTGLDNVEFRLGEIEHLPIADGSVDVVLSNCVINLSTDKAQVWREIARVLRPGGRVAVSDVALLRELPEAVKERLDAYVGCVAGAVRVEETVRMAEDAGLSQVVVSRRRSHAPAEIAEWQDAAYAEAGEAACCASDDDAFVASVEVTAHKP